MRREDVRGHKRTWMGNGQAITRKGEKKTVLVGGYHDETTIQYNTSDLEQ